MDEFLTKVEQIVSSEVKVLLASQQSIERRQARFEALLQQWMDVGNQGRPGKEVKSSPWERKEMPQQVYATSSQQSAGWGEKTSHDAIDVQEASPRQDQRELTGHDLSGSPEPNVQNGSEAAQQATETLKKSSSKVSKTSSMTNSQDLAHMLRQKSKHRSDQSFLDRIVFSWMFDTVFGLLIVLNSISIGAEIEYKTTNASPSAFFTVVAATFAFCFLVEVVLRLVANEFRVYFCGPDKLWNIFDVSMVIVSLIEVFDTALIAKGRNSPSMRLVRMVRVLRIVRVLRFIPQLRIILIMIFESIKSLGWMVCILVAILYVFSIVFTMGATEYLGVPGDPDFRRKRYSTEIATHFGTVMRSLYSLFKAITSGQSWGEMMDPLADVNAFFAVVFLCYVAFGILALLNIVASVFVERALTKSQCDRDMVVEREIQAKQTCIEHLRLLFEEADLDDSGQITVREFETHMTDQRCLAYLSHLGVDTDNVHELFAHLDQDGSGSISVQAFVDNLLHLTRGQTAEQVWKRLMTQNRELKRLIFKFMDAVEAEFSHVKLWMAQDHNVSAIDSNVEMVTMVECTSPRPDGHDQGRSRNRLLV